MAGVMEHSGPSMAAHISPTCRADLSTPLALSLLVGHEPVRDTCASKPFRLAGACVLDNDGHCMLERALSAASTGKTLMMVSAIAAFCG